MSTDRSQPLVQLSSALSRAATDLAAVLAVAAEQASALTGGVAVVQIADENGLLSTSAAQPQRADEGLSGRLAATGLPIVNNAVGPEQLAASMPGLRRPPGEAGVRALLLLPLLADGDYLGLLGISRAADRPFVAADLALGTEVAARIAPAVAAAQSVSRLHSTESRSQRIAETSLDGMWEGDHRAVTTFVNERATQLLGYSREAMMGQPLSHFLDGRGRADLPDRLASLTRTAQRCEVELARADGTRLWVEANTVTSPGGPASAAGFFSTFRDISDRVRVRELEAQLDRGRRLDSLGQFAGVAAHNFNNLLTVISGCAQMLLTGLTADEPARGLVAEIAGAAERGSGVCGELLAFGRSRPPAGGPLELHALLADMRGLLRLTVGDHIEVVLPRRHQPGDPGAWVSADRGQLEQVVINLAVNAREAMGAAGRLTVGCDHTIGVRREPGDVDSRDDLHDPAGSLIENTRWYVRLSFSDSGCGMDTDTLRRAFEPLFTTKQAQRGTGLGLASVRGMVREAGGVVNLRSRPGAGTVAEVYLPATDAEVRAVATAPVQRTAAANGATGHGHVLVVEDEPAVARVVSRLLAEAGYTFDAPGSSDLALQFIRAGRPVDLLITDVMMPGLTGPELTRQVHHLRPGLPVLFISGHIAGTLEDTDRLDAGTALLEKPFTREALRAAVESLLRR